MLQIQDRYSIRCVSESMLSLKAVTEVLSCLACTSGVSCLLVTSPIQRTDVQFQGMDTTTRHSADRGGKRESSCQGARKARSTGLDARAGTLEKFATSPSTNRTTERQKRERTARDLLKMKKEESSDEHAKENVKRFREEHHEHFFEFGLQGFRKSEDMFSQQHTALSWEHRDLVSFLGEAFKLVQLTQCLKGQWIESLLAGTAKTELCLPQ